MPDKNLNVPTGFPLFEIVLKIIQTKKCDFPMPDSNIRGYPKTFAPSIHHRPSEPVPWPRLSRRLSTTSVGRHSGSIPSLHWITLSPILDMSKHVAISLYHVPCCLCFNIYIYIDIHNSIIWIWLYLSYHSRIDLSCCSHSYQAPRLHSPAAVQLGSNDGFVLILERKSDRRGVGPNFSLANVEWCWLMLINGD